MKKAKVKNGIVQHVWPRVKTLPDGRQVVKKLPEHYRVKPQPSYIVDVPDEVKPGWKWDGERYGPRPKEPIRIIRDPLIEVISEKLGVSFEELLAEAKQRKLAAKAD